MGHPAKCQGNSRWQDIKNACFIRYNGKCRQADTADKGRLEVMMEPSLRRHLVKAERHKMQYAT